MIFVIFAYNNTTTAEDEKFLSHNNDNPLADGGSVSRRRDEIQTLHHL